MAILTKTEKYVAETYAKYFGRAADADTIKEYGLKENGKAEKASIILKNIIADADAEKDLDTTEFVNNAFQNLFGRDATTKEMNKYSKVIEKGKNLPINSIVKSAAKADKAVNKNKLEVAAKYAELGGKGDFDLSKISKGNLITDIKTVTTLADLQTKYDALLDNDGIPSSFDGKAFVLTKGVDTLLGTSKDDQFNATLQTTDSTLNSFDSIDGGAGTDTLNIAASKASNFAVPASITIKNIENVNVSQAASGGTGTGALTVTNDTFGTGVKKFSYTDASAAADMTSATISVTLDSATDVTTKAVGTGTFTTVAITDKSTTAADRGNTLKNVTVEKAGSLTIDGDAVQNVSIKAVTGLTTVNAKAGTRDLTVNAEGANGGLTDATATSVNLNLKGSVTNTFSTLTTASATAATITTTAAAGASATLTAAKAKSLTIDGKTLLTLTSTGNLALETITVKGNGGVSVDVSADTTLTSIDTTASTAVAPTTGNKTGANKFTISTNVAYNGGAGEDVVTVGATTKTINLGAGNDTANLSVSALGAGGKIDGGAGVNTLILTNANAVTITTAAASVQDAFKAAVTNFSTLDIGTQSASTIDISKIGTFNKVTMVTAAQTQLLNGVTSGSTIQLVNTGTGSTAVTLNNLSGLSDEITFDLKGDLSTGVKVFGTLTSEGAETVKLVTTDTNTAFAAQLATATVTDALAKSIVISGNNGLALTHAGTALNNFDASAVSKGAVTFTSGALVTDATVKGSATGNDALDFKASLAKVTITEEAGNNTLTGSSTAINNITGGTGNDTITGGSAIDTLNGGAGNDKIIGGTGADILTGGAGADIFAYGVKATVASATGANVDKITDFVSGLDKIALIHTGNTSANDILQGVTLDSTIGNNKFAAMGAEIVNTTSVVNSITDVYTVLGSSATALAGSAADGSATVAQVYSFTNGTAAGKYLVINDTTAGFQGANDIVIDITGISGTLTAADLAFIA